MIRGNNMFFFLEQLRSVIKKNNVLVIYENYVLSLENRRPVDSVISSIYSGKSKQPCYK